MSRYIEKRLHLKVNQDKSAVARPEERHFLGFRLGADVLTEEVEVQLSMRSLERIKQRIVPIRLRIETEKSCSEHCWKR